MRHPRLAFLRQPALMTNAASRVGADGWVHRQHVPKVFPKTRRNHPLGARHLRIGGDHLLRDSAMTEQARGGVFEPEQLEILQRVFDQACIDRGYLRTHAKAEDLAAVIMRLFNTGIVSEANLTVALNKKN